MEQGFVTADFDTFLAAYLPFVPKDTDVDACFKRTCMGSGTNNQPLITLIPRTNVKEVETQSTSTLSFHFSKEIEHPGGNTGIKVFAHLAPVAEAIGNSRITGRKRQYRFLDCPDTNISSDIGKSTNNIDACFVPVGYRKHDKLHTSKMAVACAQNIQDDEMAQNNIQLLLANIQVMNSDICRIYSFGITLDGCVMKLWYFSRSHSAVSEPVNYIDNPKFLIKAFMSFMFATPQEMGFDDTITRHPDGNFTYTVSGRHFRTFKCLSALRSDDITGRMTRVWSVNEVESTAEHAPLMSKHEYVLKDVWLEKTALTEKEMQTAIFNDIERFWNRTLTPSKDRAKFKKLFKRHKKLVNRGKYKKHFLTIETESVQEETKEAVSKTKKFELFTSTDHDSLYSVELYRRKRFIEQDVTPRKQYRVVFREKCETVGRLKTLGEVFDVVKNTLIRTISSYTTL